MKPTIPNLRDKEIILFITLCKTRFTMGQYEQKIRIAYQRLVKSNVYQNLRKIQVFRSSHIVTSR